VRLTSKQYQALQILNSWHQDFRGPSEIGTVAGKTYNHASSWATGALKPLHAAGLVDRSPDGKYRITAAGREALHGVKMEEGQ